MVVYRSCGQEKLCSAYLKNTLDTNSLVSLLFNKFIDHFSEVGSLLVDTLKVLL